MDDDLCRLFFADPSCPAQRRYEALRALFVEGLPQKEAAGRFGYSHGAFRHLVAQFRANLVAGAAPPFSSRSVADARPETPRIRPARPRSPIPPTPAS
jgi:hypothetical protein